MKFSTLEALLLFGFIISTILKNTLNYEYIKFISDPLKIFATKLPFYFNDRLQIFIIATINCD